MPSDSEARSAAVEGEPAVEVGEGIGGRENGSHGLSGLHAAVLAYAEAMQDHDCSGEEALELSRAVLDAAMGLAPEPTLPVTTLREALPYLRRPFAPNAVRFKIQTKLGKPEVKGALIVAYIDARTVIERLNLVCGELWHDDYALISQGLMRCDLTVAGVTRPDVGEGKTKGLVSDALKRAAVKFGVGVSLYAIPQTIGWIGDGPGKLRARQGEPIIDEQSLTGLRENYEKWLEEHGIKHFGEPLDHGDAVLAAGDPLDPDNPEPDPVPEGVDFSTGEINVGPKIKAARVKEIAKLVESAPPWLGVAHQHAELDTLGVPENDDLVARIKLLREGQAERYEGWLKGLPAEEPVVPEVE